MQPEGMLICMAEMLASSSLCHIGKHACTGLPSRLLMLGPHRGGAAGEDARPRHKSAGEDGSVD